MPFMSSSSASASHQNGQLIAQLTAGLPAMGNHALYAFLVNILATYTEVDERVLSSLPFDGPIGAAMRLTAWTTISDFAARQARAMIGFNLF
eukprot:NODE_4064_length_846_cov_4.132999_g3366_i0.p1 GENE.NODE_4064_length_846_cov_4.132999_g3366_i0~~NODE_4064_length_846_cov_4.132999_g3366_i0.p1  ORF type:complete len:92 (+),score=4.00 NODE_4064_length_846_cov_4.132999_g3366_i0:565-840(+)